MFTFRKHNTNIPLQTNEWHGVSNQVNYDNYVLLRRSRASGQWRTWWHKLSARLLPRALANIIPYHIKVTPQQRTSRQRKFSIAIFTTTKTHVIAFYQRPVCSDRGLCVALLSAEKIGYQPVWPGDHKTEWIKHIYLYVWTIKYIHTLLL